MRLLLVEDESEMAAWLMRAFRQSSFVADHAGDAGNRTPVLVLTAQGSLQDRVKGLNLGADDS